MEETEEGRVRKQVQQEVESVRRKGGQTADNVLLHRVRVRECIKVDGSPLI